MYKVVSQSHYCYQRMAINYIQVFNIGSTWRGRMKKLAREIVRHRYAQDLTADITVGNQLEEYGIIRNKVQKLLHDAVFLRGGKDRQVGCIKVFIIQLYYDFFQGKTANFGHPAIKELCTRFYYKECSLGGQWFRGSIPVHAIILASTCVFLALLDIISTTDFMPDQIRNCLDEYASGHHTSIEFEGKRYRGIFKAIDKLARVLKKNKYHWGTFTERCREWHEEGRYVLSCLFTPLTELLCFY